MQGVQAGAGSVCTMHTHHNKVMVDSGTLILLTDKVMVIVIEA